MDKPWIAHYESHVPPVIDIPSTPLADCLRRNARRFPDHPALIFFDNKISFKELNDAVDRFAAGLQKLGVAPGDRVALYMPNCPQYVISYYAVLRIGAIVVPCNPLYVARELEHQLNDAGARVAVVLSSFYPTLKEIRANTPLEYVIVANIKDYFPPVLKALFTLLKEKQEGHYLDLSTEEDTVWFTDFLAEAPEVPAPLHVEMNDTACLLYTGGTTGVPKGAELTHRNLLVNAMQCQVWLNVKPAREIVLAALPLSHSYGMTTCMNQGVYSASTIILIPNPRDLKFVLKNIVKHRPTLFPGVPTMYVAINNYPDIQKYDLSSIRACISGGAGLPKEVQIKFQELTGGKLVEGYGLTEASPVTHANPINGENRIGTIGLPWPNTDCKLVDVEDGKTEVPVGEPGELCIKGPQVMKGYWNKPEETANVLRDGWLYTGDIAVMDEDGYFRIVDRKKDMIIAGGFNIYPRDIEEVLYENPKVKEAVAVGIPHPYRGETVKVYVVLKEGEAATAEEIIRWCRGRLAKYKVPTDVEFRQELPKSMVGKILRRVLREEEMAKRAAEKEGKS
ncbi:MAG: long-chain fatty acid--CoA ligase [Anaerolineae bacterium]|nr:long-chain fatty acid--CoA ligase [Anaerolineae bacterium]